MVTEIETGGHKIVGTFGMCVGGLVMLFGLALVVFNLIHYSSMERVSGVVVKYERGKGMKGAGPHVQYIVDGETHLASGQIEIEGGWSHGFKPGESLDVLYPTNYPDKGRLDLFRERWFKTIMVLGVGTVMTLIATLLRFGPGNKILIVDKDDSTVGSEESE